MNFTIRPVGLSGLKLLEGRHFHDERGYFLETWSRGSFSALEMDVDFVQDNQSLSRRRGTLRGLHFQKSPFAQGKLVRVLNGAIFDVAVDIRPRSKTFGQWFGVELKADGCQFFIPRGFAHGFVTLADDTVVCYKTDAPYHAQSDSGIRWNDPDVAIDWPINEFMLTISDKDRALPFLSHFVDDSARPESRSESRQDFSESRPA